MQRRYLVALLVPVVVLLALGAVPSLLGGGDVHYVTATEVALEDGDPPEGNASETVDAANLSENRFPYTTEALASGVSDSYEAGSFGLKDSFSHSPFDEFGELRTWEAEAVDGDVAWLEEDGTYYRLEITRELDD